MISFYILKYYHSFFVFIPIVLANDDLKIESIELTKTARGNLKKGRFSISDSSEKIEEPLEDLLRILLLQTIDEIIDVGNEFELENFNYEAVLDLCIEIMLNFILKIYKIMKIEHAFFALRLEIFWRCQKYFIQWAEIIYSLKGIVKEFDINSASENPVTMKIKESNVLFSNYNYTEFIYDCCPRELQKEILDVYLLNLVPDLPKDHKCVSYDLKLERKSFRSRECEIDDFDSFKDRIKSEENNLGNDILQLKINVKMCNRFDMMASVFDNQNDKTAESSDCNNVKLKKFPEDYYEGLESFKKIMLCVFSDFYCQENVFIILNLDQSLYYRSIIEKCFEFYKKQLERTLDLPYSIINEIKVINKNINMIYISDFKKILSEINGVLNYSSSASILAINITVPIARNQGVIDEDEKNREKDENKHEEKSLKI